MRSSSKKSISILILKKSGRSAKRSRTIQCDEGECLKQKENNSHKNTMKRKSIDETVAERMSRVVSLARSLALTAHLLFMNNQNCFAKNLWRNALVYFLPNFARRAFLFFRFAPLRSALIAFSSVSSGGDADDSNVVTFGDFSLTSSHFLYLARLSSKKNSGKKKTKYPRCRWFE